MFIPNISLSSYGSKQSVSTQGLRVIYGNIIGEATAANPEVLIAHLEALVDIIKTGRADAELIRYFQFGLLRLAALYKNSSPNNAGAILEAYLGEESTSRANPTVQEILQYVDTLRGRFVSLGDLPANSPMNSPLGELIGIYSDLAGSDASAGRALIEWGRRFINNAPSDDSDDELKLAQWDYALRAMLAWAESKTSESASANSAQEVIDNLSALKEELNRLVNLRGHFPQTTQDDIDNQYTEFLSIMARAYAKVASYQTADNILRALLGQITVPADLTIGGASLNLSTTEKAKIEIQYYWNRINLGAASRNTAMIRGIAEHFHGLRTSNPRSEYNQILGAALGQLWVIEYKVATGDPDRHQPPTRLAENKITDLNLIIQYISDEGITYTLDDTNSTETLHGALWTLINCFGDYTRGLTYGIKHNFTDIILASLQRLLNGVANDSVDSLRYRVALSVLYRYILPEGVPDNPQWQVLVQFASRQSGINLSNLPRTFERMSTPTQYRFQLYYELKTISHILERNSEVASRLGLSAREISILAQTELAQIDELGLINGILHHPILANFMRLAKFYLEMGEYAGEDKDFARVCLARALAIFRGIILRVDSSTTIPAVDPTNFNAQHNLQDINGIMQELSSARFSLRNNQRIEVYLEFADATRRLMLSSALDYDTGWALYQEILRLYNKVIEFCGSNDVDEQVRAQLGIRETKLTWANILIKNRRAEEAVGVIFELIEGLTSTLRTEEEERAEDLNFYLRCLRSLAWAYEVMAEVSGQNPDQRAKVRDYYLKAAAVYRFLYDGTGTLAGIGPELRAAMVDPDLLHEVETSELELRLKYLDYLRLAGDRGPLNDGSEGLLEEVINVIDPPGDSEDLHSDDPAVSSRIHTIISRALTALFKRLKAPEDIERAVAEAQAAYAAQVNVDSFSALTWALGVRGGYRMQQGNVADAQADFDAAIALYQAAVAPNGGLGIEIKPSWYLDLAKLLKARFSNDNDAQHFQDEVLFAFEQALQADLSPADRQSAQIAYAEALILQAKIFERTPIEDGDPVQTLGQAMELCLQVLGTAEDGSHNISTISQGVVNLRALTTLAWALNSLASLRQEPDYYRAVIAFYQTLLYPGSNPALPAEIRVGEIVIPAVEIKNFISRSQILLTHPEVLYEAEIFLWRLRRSYLDTLAVLKDDQAESVALGYISEIGHADHPEELRPEELRALIDILGILGGIYCWNLHNYDQAENYYTQAQDLISRFFSGAAADQEIRNLLLRINVGLAHILYEKEEWNDSLALLGRVVTDIGPHLQGSDELDILINAYLEIANIYNYGLHEPASARNYYLSLLEVTRGKPDTYIAAALGAANSFYEEGNFAEALPYYQLAIDRYSPSAAEEVKVNVVRAYLGMGRALAEMGSIQEAQEQLRNAERIFNELQGKDPDIEYELRDVRNFWQQRADRAVEIGFDYRYSSDSFRGNESSGSTYQLRVDVPVAEDLNLETRLSYSDIERGYGEYYDSLGGQTLPRLASDDSGSFLASFLWKPEEKSYNLRLNLDLGVNLFDYQVSHYRFNPSYSEVTESTTSDNLYANAVLAAAARFDWKLELFPHSTLLLGVDVGGSVLASFNESPSTAARRASLIDQVENGGSTAVSAARELETLEDPNQFLYSWNAQLNARWIFPSHNFSDDFRLANPSISLGGVVGVDQITTSNQGFWTLGYVDTFKLAFKASLNAALVFGKEQRWRIPLEFNVEYGNYLYLQGSLGVGYNFDPLLLDFLFWSSYFEREGEQPAGDISGNNDIQTWNVNFGLRFYLPWF